MILNLFIPCRQVAYCLPAALLAVCLPLGSVAVCNYLESCQLCRLQRPKVNIIGPITKLITFSVATVCGASLAGPSIQEGMAPTVCLSTSVPRPASPQQRPGQSLRHSAASLQSLRHGAPASNSFPMALRRSATVGNNFATASLPATNSSGGEKYSSLASNLAHLGRIC